MASHLGLAFFSRDQRQLGKDLLIVYAKCLFLVGVLYFISLFRILTARENLFIHSRQYHEKAIQSWLYRIKFWTAQKPIRYSRACTTFFSVGREEDGWLGHKVGGWKAIFKSRIEYLLLGLLFIQNISNQFWMNDHQVSISFVIYWRYMKCCRRLCCRQLN